MRLKNIVICGKKQVNMQEKNVIVVMISWTVYIIVGLILFYILYLGVEGISRGMRAKKINKSKKNKK